MSRDQADGQGSGPPTGEDGPQTGAEAPAWAKKTVDIHRYLDDQSGMSPEACMEAVVAELEPHLEFWAILPALKVARDEGLPDLFEELLDDVYKIAERWDVYLGA